MSSGRVDIKKEWPFNSHFQEVKENSKIVSYISVKISISPLVKK